MADFTFDGAASVSMSGTASIAEGDMHLGADVAMTGSSTQEKTLAENRGVKRIWPHMNSYFFDSTPADASDVNIYGGMGIGKK